MRNARFFVLVYCWKRAALRIIIKGIIIESETMHNFFLVNLICVFIFYTELEF